ncbi:carbamoyltransferase [Methylonatrum kenyense]|uniref:carbamoyltransferase C-terminal domain-containing protein n=1 Tax=Methylonatrum kenyense TaxID=455253 RepID=UPI0020C0A4A1|nr:carbamoyltransferase C-terminal domain-containing protein [Methylonatrum kenyense]MCK8516807.1 carbamoyltransferase [Methylonatrum kenyense]
MNVLGITDSFTSGAAVVRDGEIVAAVNEERLDRNKMSMGFPRLSIAEVLRISQLEARQIDVVAVATNNLFWRAECLPYNDPYRESDARGAMRDRFLSLGGTLSRVAGNSTLARKTYYGLKTVLTGERRKQVHEELKRLFGITAPVNFIDHHVCHVASAYFTSGFERATVITHDGAGDSKCSRVVLAENGEFTHLKALDSYDSVGNYYAYITHLCGYKAHKHEGKITGLAAYGEPEYLDILKQFVAWNGDRIRNTGKAFDHSAIRKLEKALPDNFSAENLSASIQLLLEQSVASFCDHWVRKTGVQDVALAGGVFANVKLNERVHELDSVRNLFVHPGMGDEGLAVGAALFEHKRLRGYVRRPVIGDVYLGAGYTKDAVAQAIQGADGFRELELHDSLERTAAQMLADGKVIARSAGRMEYGPRALGNRTIMYQTTDATVNKWLNERLSRTEFMPFAPVTLWEERESCYKDLAGAEDSARFMTITFNCTDQMRRQSPAVVHVDGTARPQLIRREDNPSYYDILAEYRKITGIPSLINTSFNMHEEPIVNTPEEAVRAFQHSKLDALILEDRILVPA